MSRIAIVGGAFALGVLVALVVWWPRRQAAVSAAPAPSSPAVAPSPPARPVPPPRPSPWAHARELLDRNELDAAADAVRAGLKGENSAEGNALLGFIQYRKRDYAGAISLLDQAQGLDPSHAMTYSYRGQVHMALEHWSEARTDFDEYVRFQPASADGYAFRAAARFHQDEFAGAMEDAVRAIQIDPNCTDAYFVRGASYAVLGRPESAIGDYSKCIELKRGFVEAIVNRGMLFAREGDIERAVLDWERAVELAPALREELQPLIDQARGK